LLAQEYLKDQQRTFRVDRLILLACPVQVKTAHNIASGFFDRIYSFYSTSDMIQVLDPQGLAILKRPTMADIRYFYDTCRQQRFFSQRTFPEQENLTQIRVRWAVGSQSRRFIYFSQLKTIRRLYETLAVFDRLKAQRGLFHIEFQLHPFICNLPDMITTAYYSRERHYTQDIYL
jgi:hypothetical protein